MIQGEAWLKKRTERKIFENQDQRMHMVNFLFETSIVNPLANYVLFLLQDFPNHTMLHPPAWDIPEVIAMIVYLDDFDECGGGTALVEKIDADDEMYQSPYVNMPGVGKHECKHSIMDIRLIIFECRLCARVCVRICVCVSMSA